LADVQDDAIEVEEALLSQQDVGPIVAEEGRLHPYVVAAAAEQLLENAAALVLLSLTGGVEVLAKLSRPLA
jgi:hypothetical protein